MVKLKRAYLPAARSDGYRVLVERLWPRGIRKEQLPLHDWLKEVAPSTELRKWFHHDPKRWLEFKARYQDELRANASDQLRGLADRALSGAVTLVFSAQDTEDNSAVVLKDEIERLMRPSSAHGRGRGLPDKGMHPTPHSDSGA